MLDILGMSVFGRSLGMGGALCICGHMRNECDVAWASSQKL